MSDAENNIVNSAVDYVLAKSTMDRVKAYLDRSRAYRSLSDTELELSFIDAFRQYTADVSDADARQKSDDLTSEYDLRRIEPPYGKVKAEMDMLVARAKKVVEGLTGERKDEIGGGILEDYLKGVEGQH